MMHHTIKLVNNTGKQSEQNICFVNVAVQLIHSIPSIKDFFKYKQYHSIRESTTDICDEIANIFNSTGSSPVSAGRLRVLVSAAAGKGYLNDGSQQDTVEFLITMIHEIEKEISSRNNPLCDFWGIEKVEKVFSDSSNGQCHICSKKPRDETEKFLVLQIDAHPTSALLNLNDLLNNDLSNTKIAGQMKCDCCQHPNNCPSNGYCSPKTILKKRVLISCPRYLLIQVSKYSEDGINTTHTRIWPDDILVLPSGEMFELLGIGHHLGASHHRGHFVASLKIDDGWLRCNDTKLHFVNETDVKSNSCDILVYHIMQDLGSINRNQIEVDKQKCIGDAVRVTRTQRIDIRFKENNNTSTENKAATVGYHSRATKKTFCSPSQSNKVDSKKQSKSLSTSCKVTKKTQNQRVDTHSKETSMENKEKKAKPTKNDANQPDKKKESCNNCGKTFQRILSHLSRNKKCQVGYNMDEMKKESNRNKVNDWRKNQKDTNTSDFKLKQAVEKARQRGAKRKRDIQGFKSEMAAEKARVRNAKRQLDNDAFKSEMAAEKAKVRKTKRQTDNNAFKSEMATEKSKRKEG